MKYDHTMTTGCQTCSMGGMSTGTSVGRMVLFPETMKIPSNLFDAVREAATGVAGTASQGVMTFSNFFKGITMFDDKYESKENFLKDVVKTVQDPLMTVTDTASPAAMAAVAVPVDVFNILAGIKMK